MEDMTMISKRITGLFILFIGLTFAMYNMSLGQKLADLKANKNPTLSGTVIDASTHKPMPGIQVKVPMLNRVTKTDDKGNFIFKEVEPGNYKVEIKQKRYKSYSQMVKIRDDNQKLLIKLQPKSSQNN